MLSEFVSSGSFADMGIYSSYMSASNSFAKRPVDAQTRESYTLPRSLFCCTMMQGAAMGTLDNSRSNVVNEAESEAE